MASIAPSAEVVSSPKLRELRMSVRLLSVSVACLILFLALLLVNVRAPENFVDTAVWNFCVGLRAGWLNPVVEVFSASFNTLPDTVYAVLAIVVLSLWRKSLWPLVTVGLPMVCAPLAMSLIKNILTRDRPPLIDRLVSESTFSFPSGHSTGIAALCVSIFLTCWVMLRRRGRIVLGVVLGLLMLAVAGSRLYLGVHWGADVVAGLALGTATACLVGATFPASFRRN